MGEGKENDQRVAIVTGAARPWGIGRATALDLARRGYRIVIADRRADWGVEAEREVASAGSDALFVETDVSSRASVFAMVRRAVDRFGRIDALLNIAAIPGRVATEDFTDEQFHQVIGVDLLGPMLCAQAVIAPMKARNYGRIVNVASTAPYRVPGRDHPVALYNAAKGGLVAWTKSAAMELAPYGIVTTVVAVGATSTRMGAEKGPSARYNEFMEKELHDPPPWGRLSTVAEVAEVLADVATAKNHLLLGATIHASAGRVMGI